MRALGSHQGETYCVLGAPTVDDDDDDDVDDDDNDDDDDDDDDDDASTMKTKMMLQLNCSIYMYAHALTSRKAAHLTHHRQGNEIGKKGRSVQSKSPGDLHTNWGKTRTAYFPRKPPT